MLWVSVLVLAVGLVVLFALVVSSAVKPPFSTSQIGQQVSPQVYQEMAGVSDATLGAVGRGFNIVPPRGLNGTALTDNGKPEVLYIGGEYCPFCAVERWSMIIALSKFGSFSNLEYMVSSATDTPSSIPTFTFRYATYTSPYITFVAIEEWDRAGAVVQTPTSDQEALMKALNPQGSIPFIDFANSYVVIGAQVSSPTIIGGKNWTQIASQLNQPSSTIGSNLDAAANEMISAICKADGGQPTSVCSQSYATLPLAFAGPGTGSIPGAPSEAIPQAREEMGKWTG